jgi:rhodanese-related sulfurtransferase
MPLDDSIIVYPGHGAGSACGKKMSDETVDTLGHQKKTNYALRADMTKEEFVKEVTEGILPPPQYFPKNAIMNKSGYDSIDEVMHRGNIPLLVEEFEAKRKLGALVLDVRSADEYREAHIPGSMFIGLDGSFAMWVGALIEDLNTKIILVAPQERVSETVMRLARVGYDHACGFLNGGIESWIHAGKEVLSVNSVEVNDFASLMKTNKLNILDVRKHSEFDSEHLEEAKHFPLDYINEHLNDLDKDETYYLHCKGGYRSMAAVSILEKAGYKHLIDIKGGMDAILLSDIPVIDLVGQS